MPSGCNAVSISVRIWKFPASVIAFIRSDQPSIRRTSCLILSYRSIFWYILFVIPMLEFPQRPVFSYICWFSIFWFSALHHLQICADSFSYWDHPHSFPMFSLSDFSNSVYFAWFQQCPRRCGPGSLIQSFLRSSKFFDLSLRPVGKLVVSIIQLISKSDEVTNLLFLVSYMIPLIDSFFTEFAFDSSLPQNCHRITIMVS
jgi:hypothetical protein